MKMKAKKINVAVHKLIKGEVKTIRILENYNFDPSGSGDYYQAVYEMKEKLFSISRLERECSYIIVLDDNNYTPVCVLESDPGESNTVGINLDDICYYAEFVGAKHIIAAHNHPGEDSNPSLEDLDAFIAIYDDLGDRFFDAIILSSNHSDYFSLLEQGYTRCLNSKEINIYKVIKLSRAVDKLHSLYTNRFDALEKLVTALLQEVEK